MIQLFTLTVTVRWFNFEKVTMDDNRFSLVLINPLTTDLGPIAIRCYLLGVGVGVGIRCGVGIGQCENAIDLCVCMPTLLTLLDYVCMFVLFTMLHLYVLTLCMFVVTLHLYVPQKETNIA